jgi:RimJ/RimL family protein N-acetyltransferase
MSDSKIIYRPIDFDSDFDCGLIAKWSNDPAIRHFIRPHQNEADFAKQETIASAIESIRLQYECRGPFRHLADLMILVDGKAVGTLNIMLDPLHRISPEKNISWYGIVIGEADARGRGIGRHAIQHAENISLKNGSAKVEVGTFEFNEAGLALFKALGYQIIKKIPELTYWNGKMWADVRMTKNLPQTP